MEIQLHLMFLQLKVLIQIQMFLIHFENVVRVEQESTATFNEGIDLENGTNTGDIRCNILIEDIQDFDDGEDVLLDFELIY